MPRKLTLLVVDDDDNFALDFKVLSRDLFSVTSASTGEKALAMLGRSEPDAVILDLRLGTGMDGLETLRKIRQKHADIPVIMVTEYASVETAVEAMKLGAFHYMSKSPNMKELHAIIEKELQSAGWKTLFLEEVRKQYGEVIGDSPAMKKVYDTISRVAPTKMNILIEGENGTGKELIAREIHARSGRAKFPFVAVNCASIPGTLFESELFGHEKGSFTGAVCRRKGKLELADQGTLFLDEISTLGLDLQSKLLRAIEERAFTLVGGNDLIQVDVRLVCASNKVMGDEMAAGRFREDLFHRINTLQIHLPPLRERKEDIPKLAAHFAKKVLLDLGRQGPGFSPDAIQALKKYAWPGNVRELRNVIERALVLVTDRPIQPSDLALSVKNFDLSSIFHDVLDLPYEDARRKVIHQFKQIYISSLLKRNQDNMSLAAKEAGLSRTSLYRMMKEKENES